MRSSLTSRAIFAWPSATRSGARSARASAVMIGSLLEVLLHGALVARRQRAAPRGLAGGGRILPGRRRRARPPAIPAAPPASSTTGAQSSGLRAAPGGSGCALNRSNGSDSLPQVSGASARPRLIPPRPGLPSPSGADSPESSGNSDGSNRPNSLPSLPRPPKRPLVSARCLDSAAASSRERRRVGRKLAALEKSLQVCRRAGQQAALRELFERLRQFGGLGVRDCDSAFAPPFAAAA